jgi:hypothetical protein
VALALILLFAAPDGVQVEAIDYRLPLQDENPRILSNCRRPAESGEIVVCGRRGDGQRLEELRPPPGTEERAEGEVVGIDLPFGRVEPELSTIVRPDGWVDKRVMVKLKIPF